MIKKLRRKIIIISFVSVCIVFLMGLVVLFGIGYARLNEDRIARLNAEFSKQSWADTEPAAGIVLVEIDLQTGQELTRQVGDEVSMTDEDITDAIEDIRSRHLDEGSLGLSMVYSRQVQGNVLRIGLYDRYVNNGKDVKYAVYSVIALLVGSVCYLIISYFLARLALRPVEETWRRQRQFVADASHELKTPLAVIQANADVLASHPKQTVQSQMQWIDNTRFETERMTVLVNDLLFLAKNDEGLKEELDVVNFSEGVESVVLSQEAVIYENGKTFNYTITPNMNVLGNDGQLKQLAAILLDNAVKYSVGQGNIKLELSVAQAFLGRYAQLEVSNDSNELSPEQLRHIFDRFYTVDESRDKKHTGNGLGLAIAQTICQNHQGTITASFAEGRVTFTALLPLNRTK